MKMILHHEDSLNPILQKIETDINKSSTDLFHQTDKTMTIEKLVHKFSNLRIYEFTHLIKGDNFEVFKGGKKLATAEANQARR